MSRGNMLLSQAKGKVGSLVFSVLKGQQITKTYQSKNGSKTFSQVAQRVRLANPVAFYKLATGAFFMFAFEDKQRFESDYNAFVRENIMAVPAYQSKEEASQNSILPAPYKLSKGSLANGVVVKGTNAYVIPIAATSAPTTIGSLTTAMKNAHPELREGDMLTIVCVYGDTDSKFANFEFVQIVLNSASNAAIPSTTPSGKVEISASTSSFTATLDGGSAVAIIITRNNGGKIFANNSALLLGTNAATAYVAAHSDAKLQTAASSYGYTEAILDPKKQA